MVFNNMFSYANSSLLTDRTFRVLKFDNTSIQITAPHIIGYMTSVSINVPEI
jgi:hypothetical protein